MIISVGQRLRAQLKPEDSVGRVAGNKFGLVLRDVCAVQVDEMCNHFLTTVGRSVIRTKAGPVSATVSIGAVCLPSGARSKKEAVACAEHALTEAKHQGRGCFQKAASSEDTYSERQRNIAIADNIVAALNEKRLHLAYQTIVAAGGFEPVFHEALIRLVHRDGHVAAAGEFIPAAEQLGMIRLLDRRTLELVVTELHQYGSLQLSMNVSAMTATDPSWADYMIGFLRDNQAICPRLIVEITETMALGDLAASARFVRSLRELGCLIAIDDFGAGYTSFKNLRSLDVTMVKLDGMFISNLDSNPDNQHFVRALIDLARNLGIKTVAEWVDRPEEIELLQSYGVDYLQGFYFSKPTLKPIWSQRR
ncbi:MAG: GGDEF domain-containing phosphodiesterase [Pseudomonadota bacterium]